MDQTGVPVTALVIKSSSGSWRRSEEGSFRRSGMRLTGRSPTANRPADLGIVPRPYAVSVFQLLINRAAFLAHTTHTHQCPHPNPFLITCFVSPFLPHPSLSSSYPYSSQPNLAKSSDAPATAPW